MYKERASVGEGSDTSGIALHAVWDVQADPSYDISYEFAKQTSERLRPDGGSGLIALRTLRGSGLVYLEPQGVFETTPESLLLMEWIHLRRYHCRGDEWDFWWFEFSVSGPLDFPMYQLMPLPADPRDEADFQTIFESLRQTLRPRRSYASATFLQMLYRWFMAWEGEADSSPHRKVILRVIEEMHGRLSDGWSVSDMAASVHMSEATFRRAFHEVTGEPPKRFYENLRLSMAAELLRRGTHNVSQAAHQMGYSSPFHFCKMFHRHFGTPPSKFE